MKNPIHSESLSFHWSKFLFQSIEEINQHQPATYFHLKQHFFLKFESPNILSKVGAKSSVYFLFFDALGLHLLFKHFYCMLNNKRNSFHFISLNFLLMMFLIFQTSKAPIFSSSFTTLIGSPNSKYSIYINAELINTIFFLFTKSPAW